LNRVLIFGFEKTVEKNIGFELTGRYGVLYPGRSLFASGAWATMQALLTTDSLSAWMP